MQTKMAIALEIRTRTSVFDRNACIRCAGFYVYREQ
jgi:hypothetical protein